MPAVITRARVSQSREPVVVLDLGTDASAVDSVVVTDANLYLVPFPPAGEIAPGGYPQDVRVVKRGGVGESFNLRTVCESYASTSEYLAHVAASHGARAWSLHFVLQGPPTI